MNLTPLDRIRAYICCEPGSQPPTHADLQVLLAEVDQLTGALSRYKEHLDDIRCDILDTGHPLGDDTDRELTPRRLVREVLAKVQPDPTIGGPMPEPWPGMGVEVEGGAMTTVQFILARDGDDWLGLTAPGAPMMKSRDVTAIYDGRRCIWRRE